MNSNDRIPLLDNMKAVLIVLVVFGHLCKALPFTGSKFFYILIYSFHMPAFAFISGMCRDDSFQPTKLLKRYLYPYAVFQTAQYFILSKSGSLQYVYPYWTLWFLLAMLIWHVAVEFFKTDSLKLKLVLMAVTVLLALAAGLDKNIGEYLSLSRILVMFPFFLGGYYLKNPLIAITDGGAKPKVRLFAKIALAIGAALIVTLCYAFKSSVNPQWLFHAYSYSSLSYNALIRLCAMACAAVAIGFLLLFLPRKKLPVITYVGQNTITIYLLHTFVVKFIENKADVIPYAIYIPIAIAAAVILPLVFSSKPIVKLASPFISFPFTSKRKAIDD